MTKKKSKYKSSVSTNNGTRYGTFESNDGITTVISTTNGKGRRARLKRIRKKRIGVK